METILTNRYQIKCINKPHHQSPVEHITHVGGYGTNQWKLPVEEAMRRINSGKEEYYVKIGLYETNVMVIKATLTTRKHIRTVADQTKFDNLLSLPECP